MILDNKTKKFLKIFCLLLFVVVLTGCASNLDSDGNLIKSRAITMSTDWSLSKGWFDFLLVIPIAKAIIFFGNQVGNVAFGVVLVTIIVNIIILPVMVKSTVSSQKMQLIQPEIEKIQNKYRGRKDQQSQARMSAEIQKLYKKNDVSMFGSLVTFITLPIMFAMWQAVQRIPTLYSTVLLGFNLGDKPMSHITSNFSIAYIILLLVVAGTQFFAMKINEIMAKRSPRYRPNKQNKQMGMMNNMMTIFIVYFAAIMPAAMSLYWITTNCITILRTIYIQIHHIEKASKEVEEINTNYLNKDKKKK
ncbi:MAG: YidC/Oxa1 family membrane protein insertase [Thomasclavelia sp.]|nr:YidC/Oxa1 family membrane protein insertase [Thomasclavelia sp.]